MNPPHFLISSLFGIYLLSIFEGFVFQKQVDGIWKCVIGFFLGVAFGWWSI